MGVEGAPVSDQKELALLADWDRKHRRCEEHNRARYWCGCYYKDGKR
jgi:hypothetical protein